MAEHRNTDEYRVRWNAHTEAITETFSHLFVSKTITDVSLATDGGIIKAHRVVLSVCSMYFRKLFTSIEESNPVIVLPNISYDHMQYLMQFMYLGEAQVKSEELKEVLNVAKILQIKGFNTNLDKNIFSSSEAEVSRQLMNASFGMIPPMSHPIASHVPPMLPPGLAINPAFSLPNSLPLQNLVSLSRTMVSPSLDVGFRNPHSVSARSIHTSMLHQSKKCISSRKKLMRCGLRMNGSAKQNRLLSGNTGSFTEKFYSPLQVNSTGNENEPTDLSVPTPKASALSPANFSSFTMKHEIKEEELPKKPTTPAHELEEHINIVDLSPKPTTNSSDGQISDAATIKRKYSDNSENSKSSHGYLETNELLNNKRKCKYNKKHFISQEDHETYEEKSDDCSSDVIVGSPWSRTGNQPNGIPMKSDKHENSDEEESEQTLSEGREDFWKNHIKDGILSPYLGGAVPQLSGEAEPHNFGSTLRAFYSNHGSSGPWTNNNVAHPASTVDIPFHLRSNECTKCGRLYKTRKGLKHHIKNECGVEPRFQCTNCDWRFKQKAHLLRHMARKHTV